MIEEPTAVPAVEWDVVAAGRRNRDHLGVRLAAFELGLTALVVEPGVRDELRGRRARVTHTDTPREQVLDAVRRARCVAVALRDPRDPAGLEEVADAIALRKPLVVSATDALPADLLERGVGVVVADDTAAAWVDALRTVLAAAPEQLSAARLGDWRPPVAPGRCPRAGPSPAACGPGRGGGRGRGPAAAARVVRLPPLLAPERR